MPIVLLVMTVLVPLAPYRAVYATVDDHETRRLAAGDVPLTLPTIDGFTLINAEASFEEPGPRDRSIRLKYRGHVLRGYNGLVLRGRIAPATDEHDCDSLNWGSREATCRQAAPQRWIVTDGSNGQVAVIARHGTALVTLYTNDDIPEDVLLAGVGNVHTASPEELAPPW